MMKRLLLVAFLLMSIACKKDDDDTSVVTPPPEQSSCTPGVPTHLRLTTQYGSQQSSAAEIFVKDTLAVSVIAATYDNCEKKVSNVNATWSLLTANVGTLLENVDGSASLLLNQGATLLTNPAVIIANYQAFESNVRIHVSWTISDISELYRWYRADSLHLNDGAKVGIANSSAVMDFGSRTEPFAGVSAKDREPILSLKDFRVPMIRFCGAKCEGNTQTPSLRVAGHHAAFKYSDLTLFFVVARNSEASNYLLSNQLGGNSSGLFVGWTSDTNFRVSLNGPDQKPVVDYTTEPFQEGSASIDIWTVRIGVNPGEKPRGIRLYRNGLEVASNEEAVDVPELGLKSLPYLGSERRENAKSDFYLGEFIVYKKALSSDEIDAVYAFLKSKYL
jgi:hypothetical protein